MLTQTGLLIINGNTEKVLLTTPVEPSSTSLNHSNQKHF